MESQKIINILDHKDKDNLRFETKKWYIINNQNNGQYSYNSTIRFSTEIVKPFLVDYSDAYVLVAGDVKVENLGNNTNGAIKNCHPFTKCLVFLNNNLVKTADNLDLTMNLYNLRQYSDNFSDTTGSLHHYKRPKQPKETDSLVNITTTNSTSLKYQSGLIK